MNKFENFFFEQPKKLASNKWNHYFDIYERHFSKFVNKNPVILEIGLGNGGSLEMWNYYFEKKCTIYGIDIEQYCLQIPEKLNATNIKTCVGDQSSIDFWSKYLSDKPNFDIVIDDGGHTMDQQITTFECIYDHININGVYLCEDTHTSYSLNYGGGYGNKNSFLEYTKHFIDGLHYHFNHNSIVNKDFFKKFRSTTRSIHYYDSVFVLEKGENQPPKSCFANP